MTSPVSLRLDKNTLRRVAQVARQKKIPPAQFMREAIITSVAERPTPTPYELMADLIGKVHIGEPNLSANIGGKVKEIIRKKHGRA